MLNYRSLKDHVYEYISNQIKENKLKPGEKINENIICDALKISRTPVREALIQLTNEGYIEQIPRRGFVVKEVSLGRVRNIYAIIGALEALAATEALKKKEKIDISSLEQLISDMDEVIEAEDYEKYYQLQHYFHQIFIEASENEDLIRLIENLKKSFIKQSYSEGNPTIEYKEAIKKTNCEHRQIIQLFKDGNSEELRRYIQEIHWHPQYAEMETVV